MRYCRVLEEESFHKKPADFLFMLLFGATIMLCIGPVLKATFLSTALTFMIVYVWSRRNPAVLMNFLGVFNFNAPFMPWVLLGFSLLISGQMPTADLIGIGAGHAYYYLVDIYPMLYGGTPLKTPSFLSALLNPRDEVMILDENEVVDENPNGSGNPNGNENENENENENVDFAAGVGTPPSMASDYDDLLPDEEDLHED